MAHPTAQALAPAFPPSEFPLEEGVIYLNHAAVGALPKRAFDAMADFTEEALRRPTMHYGRWLAAEQRLRERLARLLGDRPTEDVSLMANTSHAISQVAAGFPWRPGDNMVLPVGEFPSNALPWHALETRGVAVRKVELPDATDPEPLLAACDGRTRMIAASWVRYDTGVRLDLAALSAGCRERGVRLLVDVIQGLGAIRMPPVPVDFLVGGSHKWLLGPEGVGYLCATAEARALLAPSQFGWRMLEDPFAFDEPGRAPLRDGRRFEPGTMNMLGIVGLEASLAVIEQAGIDAVEVAIEARVFRLAEALRRWRGASIVTPPDAHARAGILALRLDGAAQVSRLLQEARVFTAVRGGYLRFSPHAYTPIEHVDRAFETLERIAGTRP